MRRSTTPVVYAMLLAFSAPVIVPVLWMLSISLRENRDVSTIPLKILPPEFSLVAVQNVLSDPTKLRLFANSYVIAISVTVLCLLLASLAGYGLARFRFRGRTVVVGYVLLTQMLPLVLLCLPYFLIISQAGLYDTRVALILANTSFALPFAILMLRDFVNTIPKDLDEAAAIDGCGIFRTFFTIILPNCAPGLLATGVYAFILAWNEFLFAVVLTNTIKSRPLTVGIKLLQGEFSTFWNEIMVMSLLGSLPLLLVFVLIQKYLVAGLTAGAVR